MKTKTISLLLVLAMCMLLFAGCQDAKIHSLSEEAAASGEETAEPSEAPAEQTGPKDYTASYEAYPADQVMLTVDGIDITWGELFYWYVYDVSNIENYFGDITDWDAASVMDPETTTREYVTNNAVETLKYYCALEKKAADMGISLNEIDKSMLEAQWQQLVTSSGMSEEAIEEQLKSAYLTKELYQRFSSIDVIHSKVMEEMFGANGEKISDADLYPVAEDLGFMRAKHILISTLDDTKTELPADQLAQKEARANELYAELSAITDKTALEARMDELIASEGEDPGAATYADGYTFQSGQMVQEFETAVTELGDYELSKPVKTSYGYHIILRLPLDRNAAVSYTSETEFTTIGTAVAQEMFEAEAKGWSDEAAVETTEAYDSLDLAAVFELANKAAAEKAAAEAAAAEAAAAAEGADAAPAEEAPAADTGKEK